MVSELVVEDGLVTNRVGAVICDTFGAIRWTPKLGVVAAQRGIILACSSIIHVANATFIYQIRIDVIRKTNGWRRSILWDVCNHPVSKHKASRPKLSKEGREMWIQAPTLTNAPSYIIALTIP